MASSSNSDIEAVLKTYIERSATDGMLKLTPVMKCFDAAKLTKYKPALESSVWSKHQTAAKKCTVQQASTVVLEDTAAHYLMRKKSLKVKPAPTDSDYVTALAEIRDSIAKLKDAKKAEQKVDETTKRLTDTSGYTGAHKERFGADGKGKGIEGRKDIADTSGYVGNYKGEGTYKK